MANFCVSAQGYAIAESMRFTAVGTAATMRQVAAVAEFALYAVDTIKNFRKLRNVSSQALSIEEQQQAHLKNVYWPAELQFLNEFTAPVAWDDQATLTSRYVGRLWPPLAAIFAKRREKLKCDAPRYCAPALAQRLADLRVEEGAARANAMLLARRIAFEEVQAVSDTNFERRKQAIAMRQGLLGQAASLMQAAAQGYSGALAASVGAANAALQGLGAATAQRRNAEAGIGADPWFHQRAARGLEPQTETVLAQQVPDIPRPGIIEGAGVNFGTSIDPYGVQGEGGYLWDVTPASASTATGLPEQDGWDGTGEPPSWVK
jgi:hypothetical protein